MVTLGVLTAEPTTTTTISLNLEEEENSSRDRAGDTVHRARSSSSALPLQDYTARAFGRVAGCTSEEFCPRAQKQQFWSQNSRFHQENPLQRANLAVGGSAGGLRSEV